MAGEIEKLIERFKNLRTVYESACGAESNLKSDNANQALKRLEKEILVLRSWKVGELGGNSDVTDALQEIKDVSDMFFGERKP